MTKEKKQKIKEKAKKIVNIVCYILSICFIGLMILTGLQSCKTAESNSAETYNPELNFRYQYTNKYEGDINPSAQWYFAWVYSVSGDELPQTAGNTATKYLINNNNQYLQYVYNSEIYAGNNIRISYSKLDGNNWFITSIDLVKYLGTNNYSVVSHLVLVDNDNGIIRYSNFALYSDYRLNDNAQLYVVTELDESRRFIFNKVFNYNAPEDLNLGVDYYTPDNVNHTSNNGWTYGGTSTRGNLTYNRYYINTPSFVTNEQVFNRIVWEIQLDTNSALGFTHDNGQTAVWAPNDSSCYYGLYYVNTNTSTEVLVNYRNQLIVYDNVYNLPAFCYTNDTTWTNDNYRYLIFIEPLSTAQYNTISPFNNNVQYGGFSSGSETTIFTLLAQAFACVGSVLNITILPYMTIGMLLFLPLVVTIIVVIVHLLKK